MYHGVGKVDSKSFIKIAFKFSGSKKALCLLKELKLLCCLL